MSQASLACPLCERAGARHYHRDRLRDYFECSGCHLVFVPEAQHVSAEAEKAVYDLHENAPDDPGYRRFLQRLVAPLCERLAPASQGLDFGSGPGPAVPAMLVEMGHSVALYDPFYQPDPAALLRTYDFVTATEVIEHLRRPRGDLERLWACVKPGGHLGIMTKLVRDRDAFKGWHYIRDPTHVCFYGRATLSHLANRWRASLSMVASDALILQRPYD